jgi:nucleoside-specific outer membrane channel protein Tsx
MGFWSKGSNFADLTLSKSNMSEPASGGGAGAIEAYFTWRSNIGLNEVTHSNAYRRGPLRDVAVELGTNLEVKNSAYSPAEKTIYFGPNLQFAVPKGYLNVGFHLRKEWNHEAVLGKTDDYAPDFNIEPNWMVPFAIGKVHLSYRGFMDYNTQKGRDSFGSNTVDEFLIQNHVSVDIGALLLHKPELLEVNGGFWYWKNEYGKASSNPGVEQMTPMFGLALHLDKSRAHHG